MTCAPSPQHEARGAAALDAYLQAAQRHARAKAAADRAPSAFHEAVSAADEARGDALERARANLADERAAAEAAWEEYYEVNEKTAKARLEIRREDAQLAYNAARMAIDARYYAAVIESDADCRAAYAAESREFLALQHATSDFCAAYDQLEWEGASCLLDFADVRQQIREQLMDGLPPLRPERPS